MSMQLSLTPHPDTPCPALSAITATITQAQDGRLLIEYVAVGHVDTVLWPKPAKAERTDGLWQSSCFELFISAPGTRAYQEFNFSPSTAWAAYQFEDYRDVMTELSVADAPVIETNVHAPNRTFSSAETSVTLAKAGVNFHHKAPVIKAIAPFSPAFAGVTMEGGGAKKALNRDRSAQRYALRVILPFHLPASVRLGLSAVIEQTDGTKSYWALAHPPGKPDFHHRDCFAHQLSAADVS